MKNREQIRARNALKASLVTISGKEGGDAIRKVPALVMNHGLLAVGAFAFDDREGLEKVFDFIAQHLADPDIALLPAKYDKNANGLLKYLTEDADAAKLKLITAEALAWLNYARRFMKKEKNRG